MSDLLSERLAVLAARFKGSDDDAEMVLDRFAFTTIAALLDDMADEAAGLELAAASEGERRRVSGFTRLMAGCARPARERAGATIIDIETLRAARAARTPEEQDHAG